MIALKRVLDLWLSSETEGGPEAKFTLLGKDGSKHEFSCDIQAAGLISTDLYVASANLEHMKEGTKPTQPIHPFETASCLAAALIPTGAVQLTFMLPSGQALSTILGPLLCAQLVPSINSALSSLPQPPPKFPTTFPHTDVPGETSATDVST